MPRRVSLPGASELFRPTAAPDQVKAGQVDSGQSDPGQLDSDQSDPGQLDSGQSDSRQPEEGRADEGVGASGSGRGRTSRTSAPRSRSRSASGGRGKATGRVRHDEKITVYLSTDELVGLETARITLRRQGVGADRGRIVRAAVALALADLEERGAESALAQALDPEPGAEDTDETRK